MNGETVSEALGAWVNALEISSVPTSARSAARKALIDSVGTAIGAYEIDDVRRAFAAVRDERLAGASTVLVTGERLPAQQAIWLNGVLMNALGQEETHSRSGTHPAETTIPVVLSLAERLHSSGEEVLTAVLAGIEVTVRVASMALTPSVKYDNCEAPAVYGTIGAAAAGAKLAGLDEQRTAHAIGLAANFAAGLSECIKVGTSEFHFSVACASMHAHMAVQLARQGATAARRVFEGEGGFYQLFGRASREDLASHDTVGDVISPLGRAWEVEELIYKPYPVNFFNQSPIDGARRIREQYGLQAGDVASVTLQIGSLAAASGGLNRPPYSSREGVIGATGFCVAAMLARGAVGLQEANAYDATDILGILQRTTIEPVEGMMTARVAVNTTAGQTHSYDHDSEGRDYRLPEAEIREIALEAAGNVMSEQEARRLLDSLAAIDELQDFATVMPLSRAAGAA